MNQSIGNRPTSVADARVRAFGSARSTAAVVSAVACAPALFGIGQEVVALILAFGLIEVWSPERPRRTRFLLTGVFAANTVFAIVTRALLDPAAETTFWLLLASLVVSALAAIILMRRA